MKRILSSGEVLAIALAFMHGPGKRLVDQYLPSLPWPEAEDIERVALAIEAGTANAIQVARLCAMARHAVRQRDELLAAAREATHEN